MTENEQPTPASDSDLVHRIQRGEVQTYGTLVERYERGALATAMAILRDLHAAQDIVQDVFVLCYTKLAKLRDGSRFAYWLLRSVRREAVRAARRRRRTAEMLKQLPQPSEQSRIFDDERQILLECVSRLPRHERLMIGLRYFDGHSVKEISQMTGRPIGTVTKQLSRGIERLRAQFQSENQPCQPSSPTYASTSRSNAEMPCICFGLDRTRMRRTPRSFKICAPTPNVRSTAP